MSASPSDRECRSASIRIVAWIGFFVRGSVHSTSYAPVCVGHVIESSQRANQLWLDDYIPSCGVPAERIARVFSAESADYVRRHPRSLQRTGHGIAGYYDGVPMHWMRDWPMPFPFVVEEAHGSVLRDIDGNEYADFCLGDTGSMFGHSPPAVAEAIARQATRGLTYMLPTEDAIAVGRLLAERFGLPHWQVATTATDANRFALRVARAATGRPKILVFNGCYHGTVDETFVRLVDGRAVVRPGLLGQVADLTQLARVVEFNDLTGARRCAVASRRRLRHHRTGDDQLVHGAAGAGIPRRTAAPHSRDRHTAADRRDAHDLDGTGRLHARTRTRAGPLRRRQADCGRRPGQRVGFHGRRGAPP